MNSAKEFRLSLLTFQKETSQYPPRGLSFCVSEPHEESGRVLHAICVCGLTHPNLGLDVEARSALVLRR
eukprot:13363071-Alexandrium_andersonii.AAC.1